MRAVLISVFGLFCLAGFYFAVEQNKRLAVKVLPQSGIFGSAGAQAGAIVLKKSGAEAVRLEFKKREWALVSPVQGPVDQVAVKNLLAALAGSESLAVVEEADPEEFGFKRPYAEVALLDRNMEAGLLVIRIGHLDAGQRGRFVGIKGERTVRLVALERIAEMTPDLFRLRDKSVLKADPAGPGKASVEGAENRFNLVRRDGGWEILPEREERETVGRADPFVVQDMLEGVFGAEIREFVRATPPDQGALTLRLTYEDRTEWLRFWPEQGEGALAFGRSSYQPGPFLVPSDHFALLACPAGRFLDRRVLVCDPRQADRLTVIRETGKEPLRLVVEKSPHGVWRVTEPDQTVRGSQEVDQGRALALVLGLNRIRGISTRDKGFEKPSLTIRVELGKGELLAGLEAGLADNGSVLGRRLGEGPDREVFFVLERQVFQGLPSPWALTNKN